MASNLTPFTPSFSGKFTATAVTTRLAGPAVFNSIVIYNAGTTPIIIAFGGATVTAVLPGVALAANCHAVAPGTTQTFTGEGVSAIAYMVEVTPSDFYISFGNGF